VNPAGPPEWLVVVLVALVACVPLLCALTAIVTGRRALRAIRNSGGELQGRGLAIAGMLCGAGGLLFGGLTAVALMLGWMVSERSLERRDAGELQALMQESPLRRETAARVLARRGPGERATLLRVLFDATRPEVERAAAFTALRDVGGVQWRDHLRELLRLLGGTNFTLQTHVGELLQWDGALPLSTLVRYVNDEDAAVRAGAVAVVNTRLLGMGGWGVPTQLSAADLPVLITALEQSGDRTVRLAVIEWITSMGAAARPARPALQAVANDPSDQQVASSAAAALTVIPK
jgi:hypothetical protein